MMARRCIAGWGCGIGRVVSELAPGRWGWGIALTLRVMGSDFFVLVGWCGSLVLDWSALELGLVFWPRWGSGVEIGCRLD